MESSNLPRISIITVTYNASLLIKDTIESVVSLNYPNIEYIIIDGGSTDGTQETVKGYHQHIDTFISENDNGVFDAMNKGIKLATGKWLLFLNAGDLFYDSNILLKLSLEHLSDDVALVYGNTNDIGIGIRTPFSVKSLKYGMIMACHQSMFFNKNLLKEELYYSDAYDFYNDYELVVRIAGKYGMVYRDVVIASYLGGGISSRISWKARTDKYRMMFNLFGIRGIFSAAMLKAGFKSF